MASTTRALLSGAALVLGASLANAQQITGTFPPVPLASKGPYVYPSGISENKEGGAYPYKVDTDIGLIRGTQFGYNICNSTTQNQNSLCQTSWLNGLDDFCLWAPSEPGHVVGDIEGEMIAWCTKPGHGTRLIPAGALKGVQFMKTSDYVQVVGFIDQTAINIMAGDWGGEMDPHGADLRGNPMGGLVFSSGYQNKQVIEWHNFMGNDIFCFKACDPAGPNAKHFCEHKFDRIGCRFNAPNTAQNGTFEACLGDNQDFPGTWTAPDGKVMTYTQPPESLGAIMTEPYPVRIPRSSSCTQFESASVYTGLPTPGGAAPSTQPSGSASSGAVSSGSASTTTGSASSSPTAGASSTNGSSPPAATGNGASTLAISGAAGMMGVVFRTIPTYPRFSESILRKWTFGLALVAVQDEGPTTYPMVVPAIPPEIVRRIVDEIPQEGIRPTLYAAALTSRTFRTEAQRALFSDPGLLYIGHPDQRHNRFIDAILSSPDRLALLVWRYNQYTVWETSSVNVWAYDLPAPDDMTPVEERRVVVARVARAFRLMTNLKHLTLTDMLVAYGGSRYSVADQLLQECTFKLESFSWKCRDDLFILMMKFLTTQDRLKYLHLHYAYHDDVLTGGQFQDVVKTTLPMLHSLSAPFPVSQLLIPEKRIKFLRWTGARRVQVGDILHLLELGYVELLDLDLDTAPLLPSVLRYFTNVKLLKLGLVGPRAEVVQIEADLHDTYRYPRFFDLVHIIRVHAEIRPPIWPNISRAYIYQVTNPDNDKKRDVSDKIAPARVVDSSGHHGVPCFVMRSKYISEKLPIYAEAHNVEAEKKYENAGVATMFSCAKEGHWVVMCKDETEDSARKNEGILTYRLEKKDNIES
ncbi:hypothetical protein D9619_003916 [Psilocybe cf. subviscida]|uniref:F-box domain-containing protein n=1 Tax=Psilocybe cf. subviscida TaxID=2480587 RepID=A0A8H5F847_9AGAR|nr:hypothetical protein D9619_003916 [Psilocybe cf. subviscida]